jgi:hypothetical protein
VRKEAILGIFFQHPGRGRRSRKRISIAEDNESMKRVQAPTAFDEGVGEPVEEFRMTGSVAEGTEIFGGSDESFSKMPAPDSIHKDSGGERMIWTRHPLSQLEATAGVIRKGTGSLGENSRNRARNFFSQIAMTPPDMNRQGRDNLRLIDQSHGTGAIRGIAFEEPGRFEELIQLSKIVRRKGVLRLGGKGKETRGIEEGGAKRFLLRIGKDLRLRFGFLQLGKGENGFAELFLIEGAKSLPVVLLLEIPPGRKHFVLRLYEKVASGVVKNTRVETKSVRDLPDFVE